MSGARRGRKNPELLNPKQQPEDSSGTVLVAARPLRVRDYEVPVGVEVPGAADWPRLEAWISARHIKRIPADGEYTPWEVFASEVDEQRAAVELEKAAAAAQIVELDPDATDEVPGPQE